jgi:hypothetical protein
VLDTELSETDVVSSIASTGDRFVLDHVDSIATEPSL